jgi:hypothetical protein
MGAAQGALLEPDEASWDGTSGVTEVLDRKEVQRASAARDGASAASLASDEAERTWDPAARQPYYVPKGAVYEGGQAAPETDECEDLHEGKTLQIPKVPKRAKKARYYLPEEES